MTPALAAESPVRFAAASLPVRSDILSAVTPEIEDATAIVDAALPDTVRP